MFRTLGIAASGLSAQRMRMETIATNIANAETTHTDGGGPYRRRVVQMQGVSSQFGEALASANGTRTDATAGGDLATGEAAAADQQGEIAGGVKVTAITEDPSEGPLVYDPSHPDANADGYVRYPNVNVTTEMVDLMDARRLYEANATVFQATKSMLRRSIDL
ncbi:MAG: flagellar basal body rod protein FlgC [Gemmatimonadetes bacterium]|nr:flagellar basal body rod protein FlgC [Gemmatimonadota bacterium]MBI3568305.1 flagellar basal body rod protein FlgC [Gemmatimonadota bacterium]